jgi:hypothetical protein
MYRYRYYLFIKVSVRYAGGSVFSRYREDGKFTAISFIWSGVFTLENYWGTLNPACPISLAV